MERHHYKSAKTVIHTLIDVVSKNGNLLLSIPVKGNGSIDSDEREIIRGITAWMKINSEAIYGTRPYSVYGEGLQCRKLRH
ncbi:alpha-L-fucosidase [Chitinophaga pinensis]|uniref:alpha-L-fucosidase n=1 Tax=Chitinophaga pinensis TaxID=79329 RepID=UPI0021BDC1CB|nr:alpha-L-fucosidase [Chitinophaga pinensis]